MTAALTLSKSDYKALHRLADSYVPRIADTFQASVERMRARVTVEMVAADMAAPDAPHKLYELVDALELAKADEAEQSMFADLIFGAA